MYKKILFLSIVTILFFSNILFAQTTNDITLKPGFNFISFTNLITLNPTEFKALNTSIEDVFLFSSSAGSFLSASEGTLSSLSAGKGYIIKSNASSDIKISIFGNVITTINSLNLKTGFNLVGFSQVPVTFTFVKLMTDNSIIKGCYKWSPTAGTFIQVIRNESGVITKIDGVDPTIKAGESYFINLYADSALTYDNTTITLNPASFNTPVTPISKVANPIITPNGGTFSASQLITISCVTEGASIYYTIDNDSATLYSAPFNISKTCTIKATASKPGWNNADLVTATFSLAFNPELEITGSLPASALTAPKSNINYAAAIGTKGCSIAVVRSDAENIEIGTVTISSNTYKANIPINDNNFTALIIIKDNLGRVLFRNMLGKTITKSELPTSATKIIIPNINIDATSTAMALLAKEKNVEISKITSITATDFQNGIATKTSNISSEISQHFSYSPTLISEVAKAVNTVSTASLSGNVSTTTVPTNISTATELLSSFVKVIKEPTLQTIITQNKLATSITLSAEQKIDSATTTIDPILKVKAPVFSNMGGTFLNNQQVTLSCPTPGATIKYTIDGTAPSSINGLIYTSSLLIEQTKQIKAIAIKNDMLDSDIVIANYVISKPAYDIADYFPLVIGAKYIYSTGYGIKNAEIIGTRNIAGVNAIKLGTIDNYEDYYIDDTGFYKCSDQRIIFDDLTKPFKISSRTPNLNEEFITYTSSVKNQHQYIITSKFKGKSAFRTFNQYYNDALNFEVTINNVTKNIQNILTVVYAKNIGEISFSNTIGTSFINYEFLVSYTSNNVNITQNKKDWTILIYSCGDNYSYNDISYGLYQELGGFTNSNVEKNINVVFQISPSSRYFLSNSIATARGCLFDNNLSDNLRIYGNGFTTNTGNPNEFLNFLNWGITAFPAEKYAIIISAHGSGVITHLYSPKLSLSPNKAVAYDDSSHDSLTLFELKDVFNQIKTKINKKIDVVCYSACIMGMFEVGYQFKDSVDYIVSSEANVKGVGINTALLSSKILKSSVPLSSLDMSKHIVDSYIDSPTLTGQDMTMSVMNLAYAQNVYKAINNIALNLLYFINQNEASAFVSALFQVQRYGPLNNPSYSNSYIDMYGFASLINSKLSDGTLKLLAQELLNTYSSFVPYNRSQGLKYYHSSGVSIFLTDSSSSWINNNYNNIQYGLTDFGNLNSWKKFNDEWAKILYFNGF